MMVNVPTRNLVSHIDFAKNYTFQIQYEVQSMYFFSESLTILVNITLHMGLPSTSGEEGDIIKYSQYYISDDKEHDTFFVQNCLMLYWQWFSSTAVQPKEHWVFNDGCVGQIKEAKTL
jgi:hypothetical protein